MAIDRKEYHFTPRLGKPKAFGASKYQRFLNRVFSFSARVSPRFSVRTGHIERGPMDGR